MHRPPRPRLRRADAVRPRLDRRRAVAAGRRSRGCSPPRGRSACAARDRGLPFDAERVGAVDDGGRRRHLRRCTPRSTGRGSCPATSCPRCCSPAGWRAAGRCGRRLAPRPRCRSRRRRAPSGAVAPQPAGLAPLRAGARVARPACSRAAGDRPRARSRRGPPTSPCAPSTRGDEALERLDRAPSSRRSRSPRSPSTATRSPSTRCSSWPRSSRPAARRPRRKARWSRATEVQPASAETWRRLGRFRLDVLVGAARALDELPGRLLPRPAEPAVLVGPDRDPGVQATAGSPRPGRCAGERRRLGGERGCIRDTAATRTGRPAPHRCTT